MMGDLATRDNYDFDERITGRDPTAPPTTREAIARYRQSPVGQMQDYYRKAPDDIWAKADDETMNRELVPDPNMNLFAAGPQEAPQVARTAAAGPEAVADFLIPHSAADLALMGFGPAGKLGGKALQKALVGVGATDFLLDPAEAGAASKLAKVARPGLGDILKPTAASEVKNWSPSTLFDYSNVHSVPDVKQFDLPRYEPPRGVSDRVEALTKNKRVQNQMLDMIEQGKGMNAETFYYNEPLRQAFVDELGKAKGQQGFERYMDYVAASSPRSNVEANARNASYYYTLEQQGLPIAAQGGKNPYPYGHMAQNLHRMNAEKVRSGAYFDPVNNPKPLSFVQNLQGNFAPVTVDAHAFKLPAMLAKDPDFLATSIKMEKDAPSIYPSRMLESGDITMKDALKRPVYWASKPNPNEYAAMEQYYKRLAAEAGMTPAQAQAAAWAGGGKMTGLESVPGDPFMRSVENRANKTAAARGITPAEALSQMMRGKAPLLGLGGAAVAAPGMMGDLASQDRYQ